jgi:hypothetical protein
MITPRPRLVAFALLMLLAGGALRADDRYARPGSGRAQIDPADMALLAQAFPGTYRVETTATRSYERYPSAPAPAAAAPQRRPTPNYYPAMGTGQYRNHAPTVGRAHCTPSRGYLAGAR